MTLSPRGKVWLTSMLGCAVVWGMVIVAGTAGNGAQGIIALTYTSTNSSSKHLLPLTGVGASNDEHPKHANDNEPVRMYARATL